MKDIIYREDALETFGLSELTRKNGGDHSGYNTMMLYEIQDALESLPSAEFIRCKDCLHYDGRPCGLVNWYNGKNDFCSRAEKATVTQIAEAFHEAIENTVIAEDEYPHLREKLHRAIDAECERLRGK